MFRTFIPRWLIVPLIIIFVINLAAINISPPQRDTPYAAMVRLLDWRDPVTGLELNLPVDRNVPVHEQVVELQELRILDLSNNQLSELPPEIGNLVNLRVLYLQDNQLTRLPPEIGKLVNLQWLYIFGNPLKEIPPEIKQLPNLVTTYQ
jgi:Leucine-rich repeat (LRR) protein